MSAEYRVMLRKAEDIVDAGLDPAGVNELLVMLGGNTLPTPALAALRLYNETLPKAQEHPYDDHHRFLHFLWDAFDKLPMCLAVTFSIPFRRMLAERMFGACGPGVIIEENVRFNFPQLIRVGEGVFLNRGVFMDSKGGIEIGDFAALAEDVRIFTHGHSESEHLVRSYSPVSVGAYAKVYSGATLMPGVTMGPESIAASHALVNKDVPAGKVVAGIPARIIRDRASEGRSGADLGHIWLY